MEREQGLELASQARPQAPVPSFMIKSVFLRRLSCENWEFLSMIGREQ